MVGENGENPNGWKWGIGMWGIIFPVVTLPLFLTLWWSQRRASKHADVQAHKTPYQLLGFRRLMVALFWQLDVIGVILIIAVFGLILTPLTLAGGINDKWKQAHIIAPIVVGVCCIPFWITWEAKAVHPMIPWKLLKGRGVWAAFCMALFLNFSWSLQSTYLSTVLQVAFNETPKSATRIINLYSFVSTVTGFILGMVVTYVKRLKYFVVFGTCMWVVAMGLLIHFRGGGQTSGVIGAECLLGFGAGFFTYPTLVSVQAETKHEHVAVVTALYLATFNVGSSLGAAVSGAIWTQILADELFKQIGDATLASTMYSTPLSAIAEPEFAWGTPAREGTVIAYRNCQKILAIVGICLGCTLLLWGALLRDRKLGDTQSRVNAERSDEEIAMDQANPSILAGGPDVREEGDMLAAADPSTWRNKGMFKRSRKDRKWGMF